MQDGLGGRHAVTFRSLTGRSPRAAFRPRTGPLRTGPLRTGLLRSLLKRTVASFWVAVVMGLIWIAVGQHLHDERAHALASARADGANLARAFTESLLRTVREIDQMLLFVRALREREGASLDLAPWISQVDPQQVLPVQISAADRTGLVTLSNLRPVTERIDLSDRPHFRRFADRPEDVLHVSPPVLGRVSGQWTVQFVRMLRDRQGGFDGILVASVPPAALLRFASPAGLGPHGTVSVLGPDGVLRARMAAGQPDTLSGIASASPAVARAEAAAGGAFTWTDPADGVPRLESFRRVPGLELVVSVGLSEAAVLAGYQRDRPRLIAAGVALSALLLALALAGARDRRRRAEAQIALERTLANISQGIIMATPDGRLMVMNRRAHELTGLPDEFGPGCQLDDMIRWQVEQGEFETGSEDSHPLSASPPVYRRTRADGTVLEVRTQVLDDGSAVRTVDDVTEWKRAQAALRAARDAAEAASGARAQFLAVMSHEIRTPLNGILGMADLLQDTGLNPEQAGYASTIVESGRHLLDLLNDVLDFCKIDSGELELDLALFEPRAVLDSVRAMAAPKAEAKGLRLRVEAAPAVPSQVLGDAQRLRQVLLNLVGNAVKFTHAGEVSVWLDAEAAAEGWRLHGWVRDTGIGIAPDVMGRLFQEFSQIDGSLTRRFGGTGLGLAICRRLLEAMGGAIAVDSRPDAGSEFRFTLRVGAAAAGSCPPVPVVAAAARLSVLLAEDHAVNRMVATRIMERQGHAVQAVEDGAAAVAAVRRGGFDLVLMDVMMPVMDGLAATRAIRTLPGEAGRVKVIGVTANASRANEAACRAAGMDGFAPKPITAQLLMAEIARVFGGAAPPPAPAVAAVETLDRAALDALDEVLGAAAVDDIIAVFLADVPARLARMQALAAAGGSGRLAREAHALAGSAGTLGLRALAAAARVLETELAGSGADLPARLAPVEALAGPATARLAARVAA